MVLPRLNEGRCNEFDVSHRIRNPHCPASRNTLMEKEFSRRGFLGRLASAGVAAASPMTLAFANLSANATRPSRGAIPSAYETGRESAGLLTDERFRVGAQFRMNQFIQKGADPQDA